MVDGEWCGLKEDDDDNGNVKSVLLFIVGDVMDDLCLVWWWWLNGDVGLEFVRLEWGVVRRTGGDVDGVVGKSKGLRVNIEDMLEWHFDILVFMFKVSLGFNVKILCLRNISLYKLKVFLFLRFDIIK